MLSEMFWGIAGAVGTLWLTAQAVSFVMNKIQSIKQKRYRRQQQKQRLNYCRRYYSSPIHIASEYGRECAQKKTPPMRKATGLFSDAAAQAAVK